MVWKPELETVEHREPINKGILKTALTLAYGRPTKLLRDSVGAYCGVYKDKVVLAKANTYGNIVSCHVKAVAIAANKGVPLWLYLGNSRRFYWFNPMELLEVGEQNAKGDAIMLNFSIKLGQRFKGG